MGILTRLFGGHVRAQIENCRSGVSQTRPVQYRNSLLLFLLLLVLAVPAVTADESNFGWIKPFSGMSLEVPKTWQTVDGQTKAQAVTAIEALFDSKGVKKALAPSGMFAVIPPSPDTDVNVTIIAELKSTFSQEQVKSFANDQLTAFGEREQNALKQTIQPLQLRLLAFSVIRREVIGGKTALTYEVRVSDSNGQQRILNNIIFYLGCANLQ